MILENWLLFYQKQKRLSIKTLQRFAGKCISFVLAITVAMLFSRQVNRSIGMAARNSRPVNIFQ